MEIKPDGVPTLYHKIWQERVRDEMSKSNAVCLVWDLELDQCHLNPQLLRGL